MFIQKVSSRSLRFVLMTFASLVLSIGAVWAQNVNVKGTITDQNGEPVVGAGVFVAGSSTGVATDLDGNYSISAPSNGTLRISSLGYQEAEVEIRGRSVVNVVLQEDSEMLEEAVITAEFGNQDRYLAAEKQTVQPFHQLVNLFCILWILGTPFCSQTAQGELIGQIGVNRHNQMRRVRKF